MSSRKRVVWDEGNLEYNELTRSATQKITEPKTPYHAPLPDGEMSPCPYNNETSLEGAVNAEAVRDALSDIAARPSTSDASSSRSGRGGWTSSEDERTEDEGDDMMLDGDGMPVPYYARHLQTSICDLPDSCIEMILNKVETATAQPCVKASRAAQSNLLWYATVCKDWQRLVDFAVHRLTIKTRGRPHVDRKVNEGLLASVHRFPNLEELNLMLSGVGTVSSWGDLFSSLRKHCANFQALKLGHVDPLSAMTAEDIGLLCQSLPQLRTLNLESALDPKLKALPDVIARLSHLQELMLHEGGIHRLPNSLADMSNLRRLELRCLSLQSLPPAIGRMRSLETLVLLNCTSVTSLPGALSQLKSLRTLVIDRCGIRELPEALGELSSLEALELRTCMWVSGMIPHWLGKLRSLQKLCVWRCGLITGFPQSVSSLVHLRELQVDYCSLIKELPAALFALPELEVVSIDPRLCSPAALARLPRFCKVKG